MSSSGATSGRWGAAVSTLRGERRAVGEHVRRARAELHGERLRREARELGLGRLGIRRRARPTRVGAAQIEIDAGARGRGERVAAERRRSALAELEGVDAGGARERARRARPRAECRPRRSAAATSMSSSQGTNDACSGKVGRGRSERRSDEHVARARDDPWCAARGRDACPCAPRRVERVSA